MSSGSRSVGRQRVARIVVVESRRDVPRHLAPHTQRGPHVVDDEEAQAWWGTRDDPAVGVESLTVEDPTEPDRTEHARAGVGREIAGSGEASPDDSERGAGTMTALPATR